jgi:hypothetical protein
MLIDLIFGGSYLTIFELGESASAWGREQSALKQAASGGTGTWTNLHTATGFRSGGDNRMLQPGLC